MKIELHDSVNQELDDFFKQTKESSFLQSKAWFDFQKSLNRKCFVLVLKENNEITLASLLIKLKLPLNKSYLYSPHGPIIKQKSNQETVLKKYFCKVKEIAKKEKVIFYRLDPKIKENGFRKILLNLGLKKATKEIQPKDTLLLDLSKTEEEILRRMRGKTRYNIKLAKRKGVKIVISNRKKDIDVFYQMASETRKRDKFFIHEKKYYQKQLEILGKQNMANLFIAFFEKKPIAANIVLFFHDTATYLHGASSNSHRNMMAPHLLQFEQIKEAKRKGMKYYDFWGIAPKDEPGHPWGGITRFKKGFGKEEVSYIGSYDYVFKKSWYFLYNLLSSQ